MTILRLNPLFSSLECYCFCCGWVSTPASDLLLLLRKGSIVSVHDQPTPSTPSTPSSTPLLLVQILSSIDNAINVHVTVLVYTLAVFTCAQPELNLNLHLAIVGWRVCIHMCVPERALHPTASEDGEREKEMKVHAPENERDGDSYKTATSSSACQEMTPVVSPLPIAFVYGALTSPPTPYPDPYLRTHTQETTSNEHHQPAT
ncbi:hypothetical protein B0O80DRAFT_67389 [Mortierella sp. GBAus27b]|nr:hypothetical protein B0O80DRAFT_67389 [Mortierella sp. GBAus27b]